MITVLNLLFPLLLSMAAPTPGPTSPTPTVSAAGVYRPHCPCDIGHKEW